MSCGEHNQLLPDNRERFDRILCVLGRERISSGKHYWEVGGTRRWWPVNKSTQDTRIGGTRIEEMSAQIWPSCLQQVEVGDKTDWDLGVAKQSVSRKGKIEVTPSNGFWFLSLRDKWVNLQKVGRRYWAPWHPELIYMKYDFAKSTSTLTCTNQSTVWTHLMAFLSFSCPLKLN